jgi:hypothetical protein
MRRCRHWRARPVSAQLLIVRGSRRDNESTLNRWRANGVEGVASLSGTTLRHLEENAELHVDGGRLSRGAGYAEAPRHARHALARMGAVLRLRKHNRFYIHASGVVNRHGTAMMFVGESGSGKSTLAYALTRQGWTLLGDDGIVLEPLAGSVLVHGWRAPSMVSTTLAPYFPEMLGRQNEVVAGDERNRVPVRLATVGHARLGGITFVSQGVPGSLRPCGQAHALTMLIRQSPWVLLGDPESGAHFRALQSIAGTVQTHELVHGPAELLRVGEIFGFAA